MGEKEVELTDMITKDGKLRRKKAKKQMSSEEIREKLRKLRGSDAWSLTVIYIFSGQVNALIIISIVIICIMFDCTSGSQQLKQ